jgi:hypothetical protein
MSYREFDVKHGTEEEQRWITWFKAHNIPFAQVPFKGWAARDVGRRTVSVLVYGWNVGDELVEGKSTVYIDTDDDGNRGFDSRHAVLTIQLESKPLPFPEAP